MLAGYRDGFDRLAAEVDLDDEIAVVIERFDNACPPDVERFEPMDDVWRVEWSAPTDQACEDIGLGWVYLLAVSREALDGSSRSSSPPSNRAASSGRN